MKATCEIANLWTSKGQVFKGDVVDLPADEIKALGDKVKADKPKRKKADD